jgi:hypothetical protein
MVVSVIKTRGDLSAPVLAIIVTIGLISAGLVLMAWFWWFAPTAGKAGTLLVIGQPVLVKSSNDYKALISVRNVGNDAVIVSDVIVNGTKCLITNGSIKLNPGESKVIESTCTGLSITFDTFTVSAVIQANYGVYTTNLTVVWS